ncbi:MAG TPA: flagellar biosynthetic protein FliR [bacterium]|nr:flagellar biosynthetic protein FliR [bacterium]
MNEALRMFGVNVDWTFAFNVGTLILVRFAMLTAVIPFLVGKPVPGMIRLGFSLVMVIFLYPYLVPEDHSLVPTAPMMLFLLYFKEAFYGIAIGIMASIVFHAFEAAGGVVDNQRGAAQARLLIPQLGEQGSLFSTLNFQLGIVIFLTLNGHLYFLKALIESYQVLPLFELPAHRLDLLALSQEFIKATGGVLVTALQLTAPVLISIFVTDVVLGIMSKSAPAINVYELGFAIRGILGVLIYFLSLGLVATQIGKMSIGMVGQVQRIIDLLAFKPSP